MFQEMDNWEFVDKSFKAKAGAITSQKSYDISTNKEGRKEEYIHAYKEEIRQMSITNALVSAAVIPTGLAMKRNPTSTLDTS